MTATRKITKMSTKNPKKWLSTLVPTVWQNQVSEGLFQKVKRNLYSRFWKKKTEDKKIDEDFLLSLLPSFKKFNEDQKFFARTQIMNVMRHVRMPGSSATANLNTGNAKHLDTAIWLGANSTPSTSTCRSIRNIPHPARNKLSTCCCSALFDFSGRRRAWLF